MNVGIVLEIWWKINEKKSAGKAQTFLKNALFAIFVETSTLKNSRRQKVLSSKFSLRGENKLGPML